MRSSTRQALIALCLAIAAGVEHETKTIHVGQLAAGVEHASKTIHVGQLKLHGCHDDAATYGGFCGRLEVPMDRNPEPAVDATIEIGFEFYPRTGTGAKSNSLLVFQEGGPGYSSTGSRSDYLNAFAALRVNQDVLLMDKRGTGLSSALDCPELQKAFEPTLQQYQSCSESLKGAYFYSSANAAHDLADLTEKLGYQQLDYYGDSYATWFGQVLATLHPTLVRTMVLDSAYPIRGDKSNSELILGIQNLKLVCERAAPGTCPDSSGAVNRLATLVEALRKTPVTGTAPDASGVDVPVTLDPQALVLIVHNAGNSPITYLELDAASRAFLLNGDSRPLLRMVAEARDGYSYAGRTRAYSVGLMMQIICSEQTLMFSINATQPEREKQYEQSLRRMERETPEMFAPFTIREAATAQMNSEFWSACLSWSRPPTFPAQKEAAPQYWLPVGEPVPASLPIPTGIPILVLNGELDTVTSRLEAQQVQALFPGAQYVQVANSIHETAIYSGGPTHQDSAHCVAPLVTAFISSGGRLSSQEVACTRTVRPFRPVPQFAQHVAELTAVLPTPVSGSTNQVKPNEEGGTFLLQLASAAVEAVGDVFSRYQVITDSTGVGLRGGSFSLDDNDDQTGAKFELDQVAWTVDSAVSGTIDWNMVTGAVFANVSVQTKADLGALRSVSGQLRISWVDTETLAVARITGSLDNVAVDLERIAP